MLKEQKISDCYFSNRPDLWKDFHLMVMKYKNMNILQRLLFRIKAKLFKPKLQYKDLMLLNDTTFIRENIKRDDMSYNDLIKKEFENAKS